MKVLRLSASRTGRLYPQECSRYSLSLGTESTPEPCCGSEGNMSLKNSVTPPGIDPSTVRLVAQHLNNYATPGLGPCIIQSKILIVLSQRSGPVPGYEHDISRMGSSDFRLEGGCKNMYLFVSLGWDPVPGFMDKLMNIWVPLRAFLLHIFEALT